MNRIGKALLGVCAGTSLLLGLGSPAAAEDGVSATEVVFGMANALSGPAAGLGTNLKNGATAYLNKVNAAGGVHGRKIKVLSVDDGYEPARTVEQTNSLIQEKKVFALFGYVGTPTSTAAVPLASKAGVPYLFPFTGAEFLRNPVNKWVFNVRTSYFDETEAMVEHLTKDLGVKKIAVFIQDDAFGEAGKSGVNRALHKRDMQLAGEGRYKRNTTDVDDGLSKLKAASPNAVVMVGTYKALAAFVKKAKAAGLNSKFLTVSFVGTNEFIREAGAEGEGTYITQVVPSPDDESVPVVKQFREDATAAGIEANYGSLEGYIDARVLVESLNKAGKDLTREQLLKALESMNVDIGGLKVAMTQQKHQALSRVYLTKVSGAKAVSIDKF